MRLGGTVLNTLSGCDRKEGRGHAGEQAGLRGGCLKKEGGWNPLTNYAFL